MLGIVSFVSVISGTAMSYLAERLPMRTEAIETGAGFLLIGGLVLIGSALPVVL